MNAARVIHGIAAFMLLGMVSVLLREFGISYKFGEMGVAFARQDALPWASALVLPLAPIAWWCALTPLFYSIGVAVRVPANSPVSLAIHWLTVVILVDVLVFGVFLAYVRATAMMGHRLITPPTPFEIGVQLTLLISAGVWMTRGIAFARRASEAA